MTLIPANYEYETKWLRIYPWRQNKIWIIVANVGCIVDIRHGKCRIGVKLMDDWMLVLREYSYASTSMSQPDFDPYMTTSRIKHTYNFNKLTIFK